MKRLVFCALLLTVSLTLYAQVGIGTTTPKAFFNIAENKDVLFGKDLSYQIEDDDLERNKLVWYASKGAFRAGRTNYTQWDIAQVGVNSFATGRSNIASGGYSTALGISNTASGFYSTALGGANTASGEYAVTIGENNTASAYSSIALGQFSTASDFNTIAIGYGSIASGNNSIAMGNSVSTNDYSGSFIIGDYRTNPSTYLSTSPNQMMMRFAGGYMLYSTAPQSQSTAIGVRVAPGGNAWQTLSDSTCKENFRQTDGASFLQKISRMRLGSWNYKGQDATQYRHYGPMAQDFFAAFGHDGVGTIGEDKSINQADFDGVNLIAIQALIQKVETLEAQLTSAQQKEKTTQARLDQIEARLNDRPSPAVLTLNP